ncbi:sel1 repeat family protein, partial [Aggregatibacter actinomycetemcomitans]|nr:sel1 repeat family protein [Aggregatibacter actinomycetemcomitans]
KANTRLQYLIKDGRVKVKKPQTEVYNLNKLLKGRLPATAFYNLSNYLKDGYGVTTKKNGHYAYLRKAAD